MPRNTSVTISEFYCTKCGNKNFDIPRRIGRQREPGHLKRIYCLNCKQEVNMVEIRGFGEYTKEDFDLEFEFHNFTDEGDRVLPYKQFLHRLRMGEICDE